MSLRVVCPHCRAEWWWNSSGMIKRLDHARPDGRECRKGNPHAPVRSEFRR